VLSILARISHEEHQTEFKNNSILVNNTLIYLKCVIADCKRAKYKKAFDALHQRRTRAAQKLRYSALKVEHYVFGLKCLVPAPLWPVRNPR
jgi:hypothetical protein